LRFLVFFSPSRWNGKLKKPRGQRIREALEELGPIFVKFGQVLSTRVDILPADIVQELVKLQDSVPPFPGKQAQEIVEEALGKSITEAFVTFDINTKYRLLCIF